MTIATNWTETTPPTPGETFEEVANGGWVAIRGWFNAHAVNDDAAFEGSMQLQKRYLNDPTRVIPIEAVAHGDMPFSKRGFEPEAAVEYRWACTARTAGAAWARVSQ